MIIEDENILNDKDKKFITEELLGNKVPFYWHRSQAHKDNKPFLGHILINRETQQIHSEYAEFFKDVTRRFCKKHNLPCNVFLRGNINLTFPIEGRGTLHRDHSFSYYQIIIYLNQSEGGSTVIVADKATKTIEPRQFKIIGFDGDFLHYQTYPKSGRRLIAVMTFI